MAVFPISLMPSDDKPKPNDPKPSRIPFLMRTQAMGSSGWEAYTIGFTLVGCIVAGAGAGYFLDAHFKTSYWLPILFLVGVVAGFREMLIVLKRVQEQQDKARRDRAAATVMAPPIASSSATELPPERKRIFQVPPPSFDADTPTNAPGVEPEDGENADDLLKRLLAEADDDLTEDKPGNAGTKR